MPIKWLYNLVEKQLVLLQEDLIILYPKENIQLAYEMMKNHLVISEYPPNTRPQKWHFPMRNRIIAGISQGDT